MWCNDRAAASRITRQQQVSRHGQQPVRRIREQRGVDHAEIQRWRRRRIAQEVGHHQVLEQGQGPAGLPRGDQMASRTPGVIH